MVLSTDWRFNSPEFRDQYPHWKTAPLDWDYMINKLNKFEIPVVDIIHDRCLTRGNEITMFLLRQTPPFSYVILDDLPITEFTTHLPHLIHTNPAVGLTWDDILKAQEILKIIEKNISTI